MTDKNNLLLLFDRPQESVLLGKGQDKKVELVVPPSYIVSNLSVFLYRSYFTFEFDHIVIEIIARLLINLLICPLAVGTKFWVFNV